MTRIRLPEPETCGFPIFDGWPCGGHCILDVGHEGTCRPALSREQTMLLHDYFYLQFARALCTSPKSCLPGIRIAREKKTWSAS